MSWRLKKRPISSMSRWKESSRIQTLSRNLTTFILLSRSIRNIWKNLISKGTQKKWTHTKESSQKTKSYTIKMVCAPVYPSRVIIVWLEISSPILKNQSKCRQLKMREINSKSTACLIVRLNIRFDNSLSGEKINLSNFTSEYKQMSKAMKNSLLDEMVEKINRV